MIYEGAGQRADRMMESRSAVEFKTGDSGRKGAGKREKHWLTSPESVWKG